MQDTIYEVCSEIRDMLIAKNKAYGDSAANPVRVFSKSDPLEQINVRIDDKLSRIAKGHEYQGDDTELDLIGYLILKRCIKRLQEDEAVKDTGVFKEDEVFDGWTMIKSGEWKRVGTVEETEADVVRRRLREIQAHTPM